MAEQETALKMECDKCQKVMPVRAAFVNYITEEVLCYDCFRVKKERKERKEKCPICSGLVKEYDGYHAEKVVKKTEEIIPLCEWVMGDY